LEDGFANAIAERENLLNLCRERADALEVKMAKPRLPSESLCPEKVWEIYYQIIAASTDSYERYDGSWIERYMKANKVNQEQVRDNCGSTSPSDTVSLSSLLEIQGINFESLDAYLSAFLNLCERGTIILAWEEVLAEVHEDLKKALQDLKQNSSAVKKAMMEWGTDPNNNKDAIDKFRREVWAELDGTNKKFYFYWLEDLNEKTDKFLMEALACTTDELTKKKEDIANFCKSMERVLFCDRLVTEDHQKQKEERAKNLYRYDRSDSYSWEPQLVEAWERVMKLPQGAQLSRIQMLIDQVAKALKEEQSATFAVERAKNVTLKGFTRCLKNVKIELDRLSSTARAIFKTMKTNERENQVALYKAKLESCIPISEEEMFLLLHKAWNEDT
jgi:hypothetical protein